MQTPDDRKASHNFARLASGGHGRFLLRDDARACFEEEGRHEEKIIAIDEGDLHAGVFAKNPLKMQRGIDPAKSTAEDENSSGHDVSSRAFTLWDGEWEW
jgi:hypothetical protein